VLQVCRRAERSVVPLVRQELVDLEVRGLLQWGQDRLATSDVVAGIRAVHNVQAALSHRSIMMGAFVLRVV
jgi:cob(I)alamin adenosyltransferase